MSDIKGPAIAQTAPHHTQADNVHYDETTAFSDPIPPTKDDTYIGSGSASTNSDEDGNDIKKNPFLDPDVAEHWAIVYEKSQYECRSAFDPAFTWTEEEERKLVRRLDWHVCLWAVRKPQSLFLKPVSLIRLPVRDVFRSTSRSRESCAGSI